MKALLLSVALVTTCCAQTQYRPSVRPDHASVVLDGVVYVYVHRPTIKAISLAPPFACDEATVRLARRGPATLDDEPEEVESFSFTGNLSAGVYRVLTVSGLELDLGPGVVVISGDSVDDPAVSAANIVNRYNDVAECVRKWSAR